MRSRHGRRAAIALAAIGAIGLTAAAIEAATPVQTLSVNVKPKRFPKHRFAPARLWIEERTFVSNESPPNPRLVRAVTRIDRNAKVFTRGLPRCPRRRLVFTTVRQARRRCGRAIIGYGYANAKVVFPDQDPFYAPAPVTVFNGPPRGRKPVFLIHAYALRPAPTTFIVPGVLRRAGGRYRYKVSLRVPQIAGGSGTLTLFRVKFWRRWRFKGKLRSWGNARCKRKRLYLNLRFFYADGQRRSITRSVRCRVRR